MTDMIERVARASVSVTAKALYGEGTPKYLEFIEEEWEASVDEAKASILAMREPTEEMVGAGTQRAHVLEWSDEATRATGSWKAMIDAALPDHGVE